MWLTGVQLGSFNYSASANVQLLKDVPGIAARYTAEWERLWGEGELLAVEVNNGQKPTNLPDFFIISSQSHAQDANVIQLQQFLSRLGYYHGTIDGFDGPKTKAAVTQLQQFLSGSGYYYGGIDGVFNPATASAWAAYDRDQRLRASVNTSSPRKSYTFDMEKVFGILGAAAIIAFFCLLFQTAKEKMQTSHASRDTSHNPVKEQSQRKTEWEQACNEGAAEARRRAAEEQARQKAEETRRRYEKEQARRRAEEEQARRRAEEEQTRKAIQMYFDIFELPYTASFADVKRKYRIMIKLFHPDRHSSDETVREYANKKTQEINNAFSVLEKHFAKG